MSEPHTTAGLDVMLISNCVLGHFPHLHPMWCLWSIHTLYLLQTSSDFRYICHTHLLTIIAEHLTTRLLITQCSQFTYIYVCRTLIAWAQFLWSPPQTPSRVVLVRTRIHGATWIGNSRKFMTLSSLQ